MNAVLRGKYAAIKAFLKKKKRKNSNKQSNLPSKE